MIRTAWPADLPALRELFAGANDAPYDLARVAEEKCFGHGLAGAPAARVFEIDGQVAGAAVTCGRYLRILIVAREHRRKGIGSALLADAEAAGAKVIFSEPGNYFTPGVVTTDPVTARYFHSRGYIETRWTHNLEVGLDAIPEVDGAIRGSHREADRLLEYVEREFGRIWRFEAEKAFHLPRPSFFYAEENGEIAGFVVHDVNNRGLGFFGPTGVSLSMRGRGIGRTLLLASLRDLREMGYARAVIPWTDAMEFYEKCCGAEPAHRFIAFAKQQP